MSKRIKFFISLAGLCLSLAVLCFGVYAAISVSYKLTGSVNYTVSDAFVKIKTTVYSSEEKMNMQTLKQNVNQLTEGSVSSELKLVQETAEYNSTQTNIPPEKVQLDLEFTNEKMTYYIVFNIKNLGDVNVWAVLQDPIETFTGEEDGCYTPDNIVKFSNEYQLQITEDESGKNVVVGLTVKDSTIEIPENTLFQYGINVGINDYVTTETNLSKFSFTDNGSNYIVTPGTTTTGFAVIPDYYPVNNSTEGKPVVLPEFNPTDGTYIQQDVGLTVPVYLGPFALNNASYSTLVLNNQTSITHFAFCGCQNIQRIVINPNTNAIGAAAFAITGISEITVENTVNSFLTVEQLINEVTYNISGTFAGCQNLVEATINANITEFGIYFLAFTENLKYVSYPSTLNTFNNYCFCNSGIEEIEISENITAIRDGAFWGCMGLKNLYIPASVIEMGTYSFADCNNLETIVIHGDNPIYDSRDNCNAIIETATHTLIRGAINTVIPNTVTTIGVEAFCESNIISIVIPENVTRVLGLCFSTCRKLKYITFESAIPPFGNMNDILYSCTALETIYVPIGTTDAYMAAIGEIENHTGEIEYVEQ